MIPPPPRPAVFHGHEHGAAPLPADPDALDEAQQDEQRRRPQADLAVGGRRPMRKVVSPISISVVTSIDFRPSLSP